MTTNERLSGTRLLSGNEPPPAAARAYDCGGSVAPAVQRRNRVLIEQFVKFCLVGASGVVVDMGVLHVLADPKWLGWNPSISKLFSAEVALLSNFCWNELWTFRGVAAQPGESTLLRRALKFHGICGLGILLAVVILTLFYQVLGWNLYVSNFLAIALVTLWNFSMNATFNWRCSRRAKRDFARAGWRELPY